MYDKKVRKHRQHRKEQTTYGFKDLSYVIAIAKTQNITKAADMLYVTQLTLTKFLQNLEREMGQKLFKKLGNRFVLTYAGERYVAKQPKY